MCVYAFVYVQLDSILATVCNLCTRLLRPHAVIVCTCCLARRSDDEVLLSVGIKLVDLRCELVLKLSIRVLVFVALSIARYSSDAGKSTDGQRTTSAPIYTMRVEMCARTHTRAHSLAHNLRGQSHRRPRVRSGQCLHTHTQISHSSDDDDYDGVLRAV